MPSADSILAGLTTIANRGVAVAIAWHAAIGVAIVAMTLGWRPTQRRARTLLTLPLVSVAAFAFAYGNPFNGVLFTVAAVALVLVSRRAPSERTVGGDRLMSTIGVASIAFGAFYPHFLSGASVAYVYSAPVGLIPCPSLSLAIGFTLLGNGLGSRTWSLVLAGVGLFYGLFGLLRLGVYLDIGLLVGAGALSVGALRRRSAGHGPVLMRVTGRLRA